MTLWTDEHAAELQRRRLAGETLPAIFRTLMAFDGEPK